MSYRAYKKYNNLKNYEVSNNYKVMNLKNFTSKDNIFVFGPSEANYNNRKAQYVCVRPNCCKNSIINCNMKRLEAGSWQEEIYYDCHTSSCEEDLKNTSRPCQKEIKKQHLHMCEVLNKIENPKEFKSALKKMAYNSNVLYHSFRQAYYTNQKASKNAKIYEYCTKCGGKIKCEPFKGQRDRGDMNPLEIENVELPCHHRFEGYKNEKFKRKKYDSNLDTCGKQPESSKIKRSFEKEKEKIICVCTSFSNLDAVGQQLVDSKCVKSFEKGSAKLIKQEADQQEKLSCICMSVSNLDAAGQEHICSKFSRSLETHSVEQINQPTIQTVPKWFPPDPPCMKIANVCSQKEDEFEGLSFCERCAILRGEKPPPKKMIIEVHSTSSRDVVDIASQTNQIPEIQYSNTSNQGIVNKASQTSEPTKQDSQNIQTPQNTSRQQVEVEKLRQQSNKNIQTDSFNTSQPIKVDNSRQQCLFETDCTRKINTEPLNSTQKVEVERGCQTNRPDVKKCICRATTETDKGSTKHTLKIRPIFVTIPLKVQIDTPDGGTSFMETEITMEASSGGQKQTVIQQPYPAIHVTPADKSDFKQKKPIHVTPADKFDFIQNKSDVDLFYSCLSTSGIIEPMSTLSSKSTEVGFPPSLASKIKQISQTNQLSHDSQGTAIISTTPAPVAISSIPNDLPSDRPMEVSMELIPIPKSKLDDLKTKAERLRAELVLETKMVLEHNPPEVAMLALQEKSVSAQPTTQTDDTQLTRYPPSSYQATPSIGLKLAAIEPGPAISPEAVVQSNQALERLDKMPTKTLPGSYHAIPSTSSKEQSMHPIAFDLTFRGESTEPIVVKSNLEPITDGVQTTITTIQPFGHYKRNEMRIEIQEVLNELLHSNPSNTRPRYNTEERNEILLDLHKLLHPKRAGTLPKELSVENVLCDIRYIMAPEQAEGITPETLKPTESQESILESIKYILNPKFTQKDKTKKRKKFTKDAKEKILENLQIILQPRKDKQPVEKKVRDRVLHDLRFMLDIGEEMVSPGRPQRFPPQQQGPSTSHAQEISQQRLQRPPNEIRDSLISDLRYMLDLAPRSGEDDKGDISKKS